MKTCKVRFARVAEGVGNIHTFYGLKAWHSRLRSGFIWLRIHSWRNLAKTVRFRHCRTFFDQTSHHQIFKQSFYSTGQLEILTTGRIRPIWCRRTAGHVTIGLPRGRTVQLRRGAEQCMLKHRLSDLQTAIISAMQIGVSPLFLQTATSAVLAAVEDFAPFYCPTSVSPTLSPFNYLRLVCAKHKKSQGVDQPSIVFPKKYQCFDYVFDSGMYTVICMDNKLLP